MWQKLYHTANWIGYIAFIAIWTLAYLFYREYVLLLVLAILIVMGVMGIICEYCVQKKIRFRCSFEKGTVEKETTFFMEIGLDNPTILVSRNATLTLQMENTMVGEKWEREIVMPVHPGKEYVVRTECSANSCGILKARILKCEFTDCLGLITWKRNVDCGGSVLVMPHLISPEITESLFSSASRNEEDSDLQVKGEERHESGTVREYAVGDDLRDIHWKISAKQEDFFVKEYLDHTSKKLVLYVNPEKEGADETIELFFGMGDKLLQNGTAFTAAFDGVETYTKKEVDSASDLLAVISEIMYTEISTGKAGSTEDIQEHFKNASIVYIGCEALLPEEYKGMQAVAYHKKAVAICLKV